MQRLLQLAALALSIAVVTFFACRAQPAARAPAPPAPVATPSTVDAGVSPPAPPPAPPAPVYLPASKSGGVFLQHQQAPR